jgi:Na+-driven multidrug efflux pump
MIDKNSIAFKTIAFWANGLFFAAHLVLNGKYLSSLSTDGPAASALMSTFQSVVLGSGVGMLLGTGLDFGNQVGKRNYIEAGNVAKVATCLSVFFGLISASIMFASKGIFPHIFDEGTSKIASDFFLGYGVASIPLLFLIVGPQVAFQEGDVYVPPASMFSVFALSGIASYLLAFEADLGALGVGLGGAVGSSLTAAAVILWSRRDNYEKYQLYSGGFGSYKTIRASLLSAGWRLAFQRMTEWGNLFIITTVIGSASNRDLKALNPSMLYLILFGTAQQGFAQAAGMVVSKHKGAISKAQEDSGTLVPGSESYLSIASNYRGNISTIFYSNFGAAVLNSVITVISYFARKPLAGVFLKDDNDTSVKSLAENLLWLNMLGMVADSCRIVGAGALRGWKDLMHPTLVSFISMTVIAVPIGAYIGKKIDDDSRVIIYARNISMLFSAMVILYRCRVKVSEDAKNLFTNSNVPVPAYALCSGEVGSNYVEFGDRQQGSSDLHRDSGNVFHNGELS